MKLASFLAAGRPGWGPLANGNVMDCSDTLSGRCTTLQAALDENHLEAAIAEGGPTYSTTEIRFLPVIPEPRKILCVGLNYHDHRIEAKIAAVDKPSLFVRTATSQVGHGEAILRPYETDFLDYEGEIAIVIGRKGRRVAEDEAWSHIAGYAAYNDASARDWQSHSTQWTAGKNFDQTGGFGPWLVTRGEIGDGEELTLQTRVNGETVQSSSSRHMIFSFPQLVAYVSCFLTLLPGDVIVTGTPAGVGKFRDPQLPLQHGDIVEVDVGGVGTLCNPVVAEAGE